MTAFDEIKKALVAAEQFIVNGVELGYIRMPNPETPDSAHDTLPMIRQAQTALKSLQRENEELRNLADRLKQEAQIHSIEARSANSTVNEIYQIISGGKGEPANYHGAVPVRKYVEAAKGEIMRLEARVGALTEALQQVRNEFRVERYGEKIAGISHDSQSLPRIIDVLETALASTGGEHHGN